MSMKRLVGTCVTAIASLAMVSATLGAQDALRITGGEVSVLCPLTIGGSFEAKTKALTGEVAVAPASDVQLASAERQSGPAARSGDTQRLEGEIVVDLRTLQTGIGLRDRHMRTKYLEVERGPTFGVARLKDIRVDRLSGRTTFRGVLTLHGETREVNGTADIRPEGGGYRLKASFPVRVSDFGIPEPSYLGVGVKDEVVVRVNLSAAPDGVSRALRK